MSVVIEIAAFTVFFICLAHALLEMTQPIRVEAPKLFPVVF